MVGTSVPVVAINCNFENCMTITFTEPAKKITYEALAERVVHEKWVRLQIGTTDVLGTFDPITKYLVWTADYAIRDEAYIRKLIDQS